MAVELCNPRGTLPSNMHMCKYKLTGTETHTHTVAHTINSHTMAEHPLPQAHTVHKQTCKPTGGLGHTGTHPRHACAPTRRAHANTHTHTHMHARTLFAASVHTNMCTHTYVNHAMLCEGCRQQQQPQGNRNMHSRSIVTRPEGQQGNHTVAHQLNQSGIGTHKHPSTHTFNSQHEHEPTHYSGYSRKQKHCPMHNPKHQPIGIRARWRRHRQARMPQDTRTHTYMHSPWNT